MAITTRAGKGAELTHNELDQNFIDLRDGVALQIPKDQGYGVKVDSQGTPSWPWVDLHSTIHTDPTTPATLPSFITYRGSVKSRAFDVGDEAYIEFHIPHDYVMGSEVHIHSHWSHNSATVTGGSVTWGFEILYAKGHDQAAFSAPINISILQPASTVQYQHMVAETVMTSIGGSATTIDVGIIEPDAVLMIRTFLDSNDITDSVSVPPPFLHFVDLHYQSTSVGTKNKSPNFWG